MLSTNRKFHFKGKLNINRSHLLDLNSQPKDDVVNWLFMKSSGRQFSFIYKIERPLKARYNQAFKVEIAITGIDMIKDYIKLNHSYEVFRAQEFIGSIYLIEKYE